MQQLGAIVLLLLEPKTGVAKQRLPNLKLVEDEFRDPDIVLEGDNTVWMRLPVPLFGPTDARPHPPLANYSDLSVRNTSSIIVLIASLSESKIADTLFTMFQRAVHPSRVYAAVIQQNNANDVDALEGLCRKLGTPLEFREDFLGRANLHERQQDEDSWGHTRYTDASMASCSPARRVRLHRMDTSQAKGPAFARSHQPLLLGGREDGLGLEDFCLQIDAHTVFVKGWDEHLIHEWALAQNEYAVLTTYPMDAKRTDGDDPPNDQGRWAMPHLCKATFEGPGRVRNSVAGAVANLQAPALTKFWAAGLSFSRCHSERDVPNDPGLTHIFTGEEFSRAARLWTNGYDMYSMMRPYILTYYGEEKGGAMSHWRPNATQTQQAFRRLATLLRHRDADRSNEAVASLKGFDLGGRRKYEDYIRLTGMDTVNQVVTDTPCAISKWTPWLEGSQPPYEVLIGSPTRPAAHGSAEFQGKGAPEAGRVQDTGRMIEERAKDALMEEAKRAALEADKEELEAESNAKGEEDQHSSSSAVGSDGAIGQLSQTRDSRFLQVPAYVAVGSSWSGAFAALFALPLLATGIVATRRCWVRRRTGKST